MTTTQSSKDMFCRSCMCHINGPKDDIKFRNIFQTLDFPEKLTQCINLEVVECDEYPSCMCEKCYEKVLDFYEFQQMCRISLKTFKEMVECQIKKELQNLITSCDPDPLIEQKTINVEEVDNIVVQNPLEDETTTESSAPCRVKMEKRCSNNGESHKSRKGKNNEGGELSNRISEKIIKNKDNVEKETSLSDDESESTKVANEHTFQCDLCPKTFHAKERVEAHQKEHRGLPPYTCSYVNCERSFNRWHYFQQHLKQHKQSGSHPIYKCDINNCDRVYKNKSALNIHKRKFHKCGPELKTHMCEICGKVFKSSTLLSDHRRTHLDKSELPYVCEVEGCGKKFSKKDKLKVHKMRHAGIKNFICPHCGMRKTTHNELKIHINYHTLERTWPCHFCSKVCNSAGNLKTHVRNIHERAKDFACRFCERTFAKPDTRKYHEMTHTGEKPHACEECGRRFLQPAALRTHQKIHLKEKIKELVKN